ncbi:MAG: hypothetical protein K2Q11_01525 [Burkholderiaceae bacterium]|nr:hypothetical protein [Burkholderiaceae bacterium]
MADTHGSTLEVVFFSLAGWRLGLQAQQVRAARGVVPHTDCTAQLEATTALLGFPAHAHPPTAPQWLVLQRAGQEHEMLVDGPVELVALPVAAIHPLPPLLAARTQLRGLRALVLPDDPSHPNMALLFDATAWPLGAHL